MGKQKKASHIRKMRISTLALFVAAVLLLIGSAVGSTKAALTYFSENYTAQIQAAQIGVTLLENGKAVSTRDFTGASTDDGFTSSGSGKLLENLLKDGEQLKPGQKYEETLAVQNSGGIDAYVRVRVTKNWMNADGKTKNTSLSPDQIDLKLADGWIIDGNASTKERTVLYYPKALAAGATSSAFADGIRIDTSVLTDFTTQETVAEDGSATTTTVYAYDGAKFSVTAEVDAVQAHNAADAAKSAWGVDVRIGTDGTLSLAQ